MTNCSEKFGQAVADGVLALTLNKRLPKPAQMPECLERIRGAAHVRSGWSSWPTGSPTCSRLRRTGQPSRIQDYHRELQVILEALGSASVFLAQRLRDKIAEYAVFADAGKPAPLNRDQQGEITMGEKGKKDKGGREKRKKPKLDPKERRKLKREKEHQHSVPSVVPIAPPAPPA